MKVDGKPYRAIWLAEDGVSVEIIDQTKLPHEFVTAKLRTLEDAATAIRDMQVRGAPLIGVTAAFGICLALRRDASDAGLARASATLEATRPTAVNLASALARMRAALEPCAPADRLAAAYARAAELADEDVAQNRAIAEHGLALIRDIARAKAVRRDARSSAEASSQEPIRIMTHCNAGWLATVDVGTALAPVYAAHDAGVPIEVWVSETRPRSQGSFLTAWELASHGVPHVVIVDNAAGHLMQRGDVDAVIVGADRVTRRGDVANKIGTYLKALAARASSIPFYVAAPSSSIDWNMQSGAEIPIEERSPAEVTHLAGMRLVPAGSAALNPAFDVTPASLVTGLVTERGICDASQSGLSRLFPERR